MLGGMVFTQGRCLAVRSSTERGPKRFRVKCADALNYTLSVQEVCLVLFIDGNDATGMAAHVVRCAP